MQPRITITNNAARHPPEKWAMLSAEAVFPTDDLEGERAIDARDVQTKIARALLRHHADIQQEEQARLAEGGAYDAPHEVSEDRLATVIAAIQEAAAGSPWADHVRGAAVVAAMLAQLGAHFATAQHIERQAHAKQSAAPEAQDFLARLHAPHEPA